MNDDQAERWVVISALIVLGVYAYRRLTETPAQTFTLKSAVGQGPPLPLGAFVTAWGVTFLGVSILAAGSAPLGGSFALLIMTSDFLSNAPALFGDVTKQTTRKQTPGLANAGSVHGAGTITPGH